MTKTEPNAGYAGGIGKRSKARRLSYALKGAPMRTKDLKLNAVAGIAECRKLRDRVSELMKSAEADPADAMVFCVFANSDLSGSMNAEMSLTNGPSDLALASRFVNAIPIGFLVFVQDKEDPQQPIFGHARPLIVEDPQALRLTERALVRATEKMKDRLAELGLIPNREN